MDVIPTELRQRLADGGCVRVGSGDVEQWDPEAWGAEHDRTVVVLDTVDSLTARDLIQAFDQAFGFPEECEEWDQIDDCLADYDVSPASGALIVWSGWETVAAEDERIMATAVDALGTAVQTWGDDGVPWTVVVVGDGPSWDLAWAGAGSPPWELDLSEDEDEDDDLEDEYGAFDADPIAGSRW
jgi:hypothetical protein